MNDKAGRFELLVDPIGEGLELDIDPNALIGDAIDRWTLDRCRLHSHNVHLNIVRGQGGREEGSRRESERARGEALLIQSYGSVQAHAKNNQLRREPLDSLD